ncbi:MAG: GIY-YIG nuclease family protein [Patescibacteria group bacterium]|jgi:putative endonuclease
MHYVYVYVLFSVKDRQLYVGLTDDLRRRWCQHRTGMVRSTRDRRPLKLIYYEAYLTRIEAARRERYLKGGNGRAALKKQLDVTFSRLGYRHLD